MSSRGRGNDEVLSALLTTPISAATGRRSAYENLRIPPERRALRELPRLVRGALRLAWHAGRWPVVVSAGLQLVAAGGLLVQLLVARSLLQKIVLAEQSHLGFRTVIPGVLAIVAVTALVAVVSALQDEVSTLMGELVSREASRQLLDVAGAVDLEAYDVPGFHDRLERARMNVQARPVIAVNSLVGLLSGAISCLGVAAALFALAPAILPVAAVPLIPLWWSTTRNSRALYRFAIDMTPSDRERGYVQRVLTTKDAAKEIRAFALGVFFRERFESLYDGRLLALRRLIRTRVTRSLAGAVVSSVATASGVAVLVWLLLSHRTNLASTGTATLGILYLGQRLRGMIGNAGTLYESALFVDDFTLFLDVRDQLDSRENEAAAPVEFSRIVADDISFTYPGSSQPALDGVSIEIRRGEVVALVGANGSGKTTLANLLALLYSPDKGRLLWGSVDTSTLDHDALRGSISAIFQDFGRYWISARENIGIGATERLHDMDAIAGAAGAAGADDFLEVLPNGYDTVLSRAFEGGRELSVGQWQRVALARALFRDAPFVIMDEPTASLDAASEYRLFEVIRQACRGRGVLLISHRFSSVRSADRIYVLDRGKVIESGTHDELMADDGRYAHMFSLQASAYVDRT